jgi:hypothetical protein
MKQFVGLIIVLVGVVCLVFGVLFIVQASSARQEVADSIAPLKLSELNDKYDTVEASHTQIRAAEEPKIQAGQAAPSATYNYLSAQRALLGLARTNAGVATFVQNMGIIEIVMGIAFLFTGWAVARKSTA